MIMAFLSPPMHSLTRYWWPSIRQSRSVNLQQRGQYSWSPQEVSGRGLGVAVPGVQLHDRVVGVLDEAGIGGPVQLFLHRQCLLKQLGRERGERRGRKRGRKRRGGGLQASSKASGVTCLMYLEPLQEESALAV